MKPQELKQDEQKTINGGTILGGDDNMLTAISQGFVRAEQMDDDGDTSSSMVDFGSGSLLQNESD